MESENNDGSDFLGNNRFPEGMRVLVVDDNCVCLKTLVALLEKCRYKVTAATTAVEALKLLRENKDGFDVVITDVIMPEMDGFTLLELINLEIKDLPVILLSAFADKSNVMKGIESGAQVYLLKPPRFEEIKNIWQHVVRRNLSNATKSNKPTIQRDAALSNDEAPLPTQVGEGEEPNKESKCDEKNPSKKKRRVQWNERIHKKFVDAVFRLGVDRAVPKRILEIMNEPGLSRENIASHLQKYRKSRDNEKKNAYSSNSGVVNPQRPAVSSSGNHRSRPELQGAVVAPMGHEMTQLGNQTYSSANHNHNHNNNSFMSPNPHLVHPNHPDLLIQAQMQQGPYLAPDLDVPKMRSSGHADSTGIMPWMQQDYQNYNRSFRLQNQHGGEDIRKPVFSQTPSYGGSWEPGSSSVWPVGCGPGPVQLSGAGSELAGMRRFNAGPTCDSVVSIPNFSPVVRNEGGSYFNINGGGGTGDVDYRGTINAYPLNMQGPAMETNPFQYGRSSFDPIAQNNMDEEEISTLLDTLNSRM